MPKTVKCINSFGLHILAMSLMLCDHMWATVVPGNMWLTNIGRMAFPIFAFMLVEGFYHTKNVKKYLLRLLIGAIISEIPFNLMYGGSVFYPYHQNVMWPFLLSVLCMWATETIKKKNKILGYILGVLIFLLAAVLGFAGMLDYYGFGILMVAVFYFFRGDAWWLKLLQIVGLYYINVEMLGGMSIDVPLFGRTFEIVQQGIAVMAMIPILLYNGKQGYHSKWFQYTCYLFYPAHMLVLSLIALFLM